MKKFYATEDQDQGKQIETAMNYLNTDLICYRVDDPPALAQAQADSWDPWLAWFEKTFGTALQTTTGLAALTQEQEAVLEYIQALAPEKLTILAAVVPLCGSLVLGLAFVAQEISIDELISAITVEETYKEEIYDVEKYGRDPDLEKHLAAIRRDLETAENVLKTL